MHRGGCDSNLATDNWLVVELDIVAVKNSNGCARLSSRRKSAMDFLLCKRPSHRRTTSSIFNPQKRDSLMIFRSLDDRRGMDSLG